MDFKKEIIEKIAKECHEVNKAFCELCCNDSSQKDWDDTPESIRNTTIEGVKFIVEYYKANNAVPPPAMLHEKWVQEKKKAGYKYGVIKCDKEKTHPLLIDYKQMPDIQKGKDFLMMYICKERILLHSKKNKRTGDL